MDRLMKRGTYTTQKAARAAGFRTAEEWLSRKWWEAKVPRENARPLLINGKAFFSAGQCEEAISVVEAERRNLGVPLDVEPVGNLPGRHRDDCVFRRSDCVPYTQDSKSKIRNVYLSHTDLKRRGWTDSLIRRFLKTPHATPASDHRVSGPPMPLYSLQKVKGIEKGDDFQNALCTRGLHTYHGIAGKKNGRGDPICRICGKDAIDWERLHRRNIGDVDYTLAQLKTDRFLFKRWFKELDAAAWRAMDGLRPMGIRDSIRKRVKTSVGPAQPFRDGTQTPFRGNIIYYGQHATATCCRKCIEKWHGISRNRELTEEEMAYLAELLLVYVRFKLPGLGGDCRSK